MQRSCSFPTSHPLRHESDTLSLYLYGNTENEALRRSVRITQTFTYLGKFVHSYPTNLKISS